MNDQIGLGAAWFIAARLLVAWNSLPARSVSSRRWTLTALAVLMIARPATSAGQAPRVGVVAGTVSDSAGKPLQGVEVSLTGANRRTYTRVDGSFLIDNVA